MSAAEVLRSSSHNQRKAPQDGLKFDLPSSRLMQDHRVICDAWSRSNGDNRLTSSVRTERLKCRLNARQDRRDSSHRVSVSERLRHVSNRSSNSDRPRRKFGESLGQ